MLDPSTHEGQTNTWLTPLELIHSLGEFDLDPCGFQGHQTAKRLIVLPDDGFTSEWNGRVWLNPPYGKETGKWLEKLSKHGNGIALVFARTDTEWFQKYKPDMIFFLKGRVKFLKPDMTFENAAGTGSALLCWGRNNCGAVLSSELKGVWTK